MAPKIKRRTFSGSRSAAVTEREKHNRLIAAEAAEEGIVLLKNDGMLPLDKHVPVGLFGAGAGCTVKGGTGSGDVCARETVTILRGMKNEGFEIRGEKWLNHYRKRYQAARLKWRDEILDLTAAENSPGFFECYSSRPFHFPKGPEILKEDIGEAKTAIYVISRNAGENADRTLGEGDYELSTAEKREIETLCGFCDQLAVLINSGAQIDIEWLLAHEKIRAILYVCQPGMEGGNAVAGVLSGRITPSGKLTDTWAVHYSDFPNAETFGTLKGENSDEIYSEGIFVGYRYFDAFGVVPGYPFGYGLSYTEFEICPRDAIIENTETVVHIAVKNAGRIYSGKEVVQIYLSCPLEHGNELKKLAAFGKTKLLAPGEEEVLELRFDQKRYASYCEEESCWKIDAGIYVILAGNSSDHVMPAALVNCGETIVIERDHKICPLKRKVKELKPDESSEAELRDNWISAAKISGITELKIVPEEIARKRYRLRYEEETGKIALKLTDEELVRLSCGEVSRGHEAALGAAGIMVPGAAGETSSFIEERYNIPPVSMADGPAGLRLMKEYEADIEGNTVYSKGIMGAIEDGLFSPDDEEVHPGAVTCYQFCTAFPVGAMLAQTWNTDLLERVGRAVGTELQEMGVSWWLAPGMNIHRNPLCGRNFEYFSEDPVVSGKMAAAITRGVQSIPGVGTTIKHFCCNNRENARMKSDSVLTERTLREIYLTGFEIAVKEAHPMAVMSSYNLVNGVHTASSYDLLTSVLRDEWDFEGIVMTDWTTTSEAGGAVSWEVMAAGGNLIMPGLWSDHENIAGALRDGSLDREILRERISVLLSGIMQTNAYEDSISYTSLFTERNIDNSVKSSSPHCRDTKAEG